MIAPVKRIGFLHRLQRGANFGSLFKAAFDAGATVRTLLRDWYGVVSEATTTDSAFYETRAFQRSMRYAYSAALNRAQARRQAYRRPK
jgi:hypothetical protein